MTLKVSCIPTLVQTFWLIIQCKWKDIGYDFQNKSTPKGKKWIDHDTYHGLCSTNPWIDTDWLIDWLLHSNSEIPMLLLVELKCSFSYLQIPKLWIALKTQAADFAELNRNPNPGGQFKP